MSTSSCVLVSGLHQQTNICEWTIVRLVDVTSLYSRLSQRRTEHGVGPIPTQAQQHGLEVVRAEIPQFPPVSLSVRKIVEHILVLELNVVINWQKTNKSSQLNSAMANKLGYLGFPEPNRIPLWFALVFWVTYYGLSRTRLSRTPRHVEQNRIPLCVALVFSVIYYELSRTPHYLEQNRIPLWVALVYSVIYYGLPRTPCYLEQNRIPLWDALVFWVICYGPSRTRLPRTPRYLELFPTPQLKSTPAISNFNYCLKKHDGCWLQTREALWSVINCKCFLYIKPIVIEVMNARIIDTERPHILILTW